MKYRFAYMFSYKKGFNQRYILGFDPDGEVLNEPIYTLDGKFERYINVGFYTTPLASDYIFDSVKEAADFIARKVDHCPATGEIIGYKKARLQSYLDDSLGVNERVMYWGRSFDLAVDCIITLRIPPEAKRTGTYWSKKCRAEYAEVLKIERIVGDGKSLKEVDNPDYYGISCFFWGEYRSVYTVGKTVYADSFDDNKEKEYSHGIHFFLTKEEALDFS